MKCFFGPAISEVNTDTVDRKKENSNEKLDVAGVIFAFVALNGPLSAQSTMELIPFKNFLENAQTASFDQTRPGSRVKDAAAFEEMRRHLLTMYQGVEANHTFVLDGAHFDCVPAAQQPSIRILGLGGMAERPPQSLLKGPGKDPSEAASAASEGPTNRVEAWDRTSRAMVKGQATLMRPLGLVRRPSSNSPPSLRVRNARLYDCKYSFPESVMERPRGLRCTRRTPRCLSSRVNARLTVEAGRCISFAAAVSVPACATATNVRTSLRSRSFIGSAFFSRPHKGGNRTILRGFVRLREPRHAANLP